MFKIGLVINPFAGVGGRVGLKGSDGDEIREKSLALGAQQLAMQKTKNCLIQCQPLLAKFKVYTVAGDMGATVCEQLGLDYEIVYQAQEPSSDLILKKR